MEQYSEDHSNHPHSSDVTMARELTPKQEAFLEAYLECGRAAEAYRRAYNSKAAPIHAAKEGKRLLNHPHIASLVAEAKERSAQRTIAAVEQYELSPSRVLLELHRLAYANLATFAHKMPEELTEAEGRSLQSVTVEHVTIGQGPKAQTIRRVKYGIHNKRGALELIGRAQRMFPKADSDANDAPAPAVPVDPSDEAAAARRKARRDEVLAELNRLARPEPLEIEGSAEPEKPNGVHINGTTGKLHR